MSAFYQLRIINRMPRLKPSVAKELLDWAFRDVYWEDVILRANPISDLRDGPVELSEQYGDAKRRI
jgi:hypothetical protein